MELRGSSIVQELAYHTIKPFHLAFHHLGDLATAIVCLSPICQDACKPLDGAQRIADLMGDSSSQATDTGQPFTPPEPFFQLPDLRHIGEEQDAPHNAVFPVADACSVHEKGYAFASRKET